MIPTIRNIRGADKPALVALLGDFLATRALGVVVGDDASKDASDALARARRGTMGAHRASLYASLLAAHLVTKTDTSFPSEARPRRDRLLRAIIALCQLVADDSADVNEGAAAVLALAVDGDAAADVEAAEQDLIARLVRAQLVVVDPTLAP